jgi:hypothetical protein
MAISLAEWKAGDGLSNPPRPRAKGRFGTREARTDAHQQARLGAPVWVSVGVKPFRSGAELTA